MGRRAIHRHRFPRRLLPEVSPVSKFVSGAGDVQLSENEKPERSRPNMRFPLSQAADIATYIARNKLRPRPEWQNNVAVSDDANPFRIIHTQIPERVRVIGDSDVV